MVMLLCFRGGIATRDFAVDADGLVVFGAAGPHADKAIRRAAALIRALPDTPLAAYREKTASMPAATEGGAPREDPHRSRHLPRVPRRLLERTPPDHWHIKPWADCESAKERLDVNTGFLLAAHLHAAKRRQDA
jgi:hypothetical protein